jgi:hypothetical protein
VSQPNGGWLTLRSAAFARHTKSILAKTKQRWVARLCGSCKGAGFSGVSGRRDCEAIRKEKEKEVGSRSLISSRPRCGRVRDDNLGQGRKAKKKTKAGARKRRRCEGKRAGKPPRLRSGRLWRYERRRRPEFNRISTFPSPGAHVRLRSNSTRNEDEWIRKISCSYL